MFTVKTRTNNFSKGQVLSATCLLQIRPLYPGLFENISFEKLINFFAYTFKENESW